MSDNEIMEKHIKTHTVHSDLDNAAVSVLENFLKSFGKINTNFAARDKWPNTDGTFEFVSNPDLSRIPEQSFFVQIKGTHYYSDKEGVFKYSLKDLAFPAFIGSDVTLDPGILFVVADADIKGKERVFWKYMSVEFIKNIDFSHDSITINFNLEEEILYTEESVNEFCKHLEKIIDRHLFVNKLSLREYSRLDIEKIIKACNIDITESIDKSIFYDLTRDDVSRRILPRLNDLCSATLLLNALDTCRDSVNLQFAWEHAMLDIDTKYLGDFLKGLKYIDNRVPDDGQSERLMLKYYNFLWQIRKLLSDKFKIKILHNLEKFPIKTDKLDDEYHAIVAEAINHTDLSPRTLGKSRFFIQKKTPFFVGTERYYELTLQLAGVYATKYNRITAYTKQNISTDYSIQVGYVDANINLWDIDTNIKIITNWHVSIDPPCLNKLGKILRTSTNISSRYIEYIELMDFLTRTGINLLNLIDLQEVDFSEILSQIYKSNSTSLFKDVLVKLQANYSKKSNSYGKNTIRYLLMNLREETLERVLPNRFSGVLENVELYLSSKCKPFEKNPFVSNLAGAKTSEGSIAKLVDAAGQEEFKSVKPYIAIKNLIKNTGEIYFNVDQVANEKTICKYNDRLDVWEQKNGYRINITDNIASIEVYEITTLRILEELIKCSQRTNKGQQELNRKYLRECGIVFGDPIKEIALRNAFINSRLLLVYGAAGTGKTTLINYISNMMSNRRKLFLTKTHTAKQNLQRRIDNPGTNADFISIDSFTRTVSLEDYDIIFVDECSTIDNRTMLAFLRKISSDTLLVLAGDIYQIESIEFGNWFYYAKDIINRPYANIELLNTWRTQDSDLINLWNEVRVKGPLITEKLAMDGPFSEDIGKNVLEETGYSDEVVLCLNYDGKFGLNNINSYFQNKNPSKPVTWEEWTYKEGDRILFNDTKRFSLLYNNLKGKIVDIKKDDNQISFTVNVPIVLTETDCAREEIELIDNDENSSIIKFSVYKYDEEQGYNDEEYRMKCIIPFQLAYAVSIHKSQGLEYDSVKVVIPSVNSEKITHGIFYTAITRAKKRLKIYWSSETMEDIISSFSGEKAGVNSLEIVKKKLSEK